MFSRAAVDTGRRFLCKKAVVTIATIANDVGSQQCTQQSTNKRKKHGDRNGVHSGGNGDGGSLGSGSGNGGNGGNGGSGDGSA